MHRALAWSWMSGAIFMLAVAKLAEHGVTPLTWWYVLGVVLASLLLWAAKSDLPKST